MYILWKYAQPSDTMPAAAEKLTAFVKQRVRRLVPGLSGSAAAVSGWCMYDHKEGEKETGKAAHGSQKFARSYQSAECFNIKHDEFAKFQRAERNSCLKDRCYSSA